MGHPDGKYPDESMVSSVASPLGVMFLERSIRKGNVVRIPSIGIILVAKHLTNSEGAISPTVEAITEALQECLTAQERMLERETDPERRSEIEERIVSLRDDLADPSEYLS